MEELPALIEFYKNMHNWLDGDLPKHAFDKSRGLCGNLFLFCINNKIKEDHSLKLDLLMTQQFLDAGLHEAYAFNYSDSDDNDDAYEKYCSEKNKYTNLKRLRWIAERSLMVPIDNIDDTIEKWLEMQKGRR